MLQLPQPPKDSLGSSSDLVSHIPSQTMHDQWHAEVLWQHIHIKIIVTIIII